jgi:hypothetical protein
MTTVRLLVQIGRSGRPVHEDVPAEPEGRRWRLLASPGLAMGAAAGDLLEVRDDQSFEVVERGGNVAVHVSAPPGADADVDRLKGEIEGLGGWSDGKGWTRDRSTLTVFTIPFRAGFPAIESTLNTYRKRVPTGEWYYVNVYDPADDSTPLNWWVS